MRGNFQSQPHQVHSGQGSERCALNGHLPAARGLQHTNHLPAEGRAWPGDKSRGNECGNHEHSRNSRFEEALAARYQT